MNNLINTLLENYSYCMKPFLELDTFNKFPKLLRDNNTTILILEKKYSEIIEPWIDPIVQRLNDAANVEITHTYNGNPVRSQLKNISFLMPLVVELENIFDGNSITVSVYRLYPTSMPRQLNSYNVDSKEYWVSEMWHTDNEENNVFKLAVYLTDVSTIDDAPFQYLKNYASNYYLYQKNKEKFAWRKYRINDLDPPESEIETVYGPAGTTLLFGPNFIHKGNFARSKIRDILTITFAR